MRLLLTLTILFVGSLAGSYAVAPVPKPKPKPNSVAEKLIGTWKLIRFSNGHLVSPKLHSTREFTIDGRMIIRSTDPRNGTRKEEATYRVEGETVHCHFKQRQKDRNLNLAIKELTRNKLVFFDPDSTPDKGVEYQRIENSAGK